jgi:hypothetical protein
VNYALMDFLFTVSFELHLSPLMHWKARDSIYV